MTNPCLGHAYISTRGHAWTMSVDFWGKFWTFCDDHWFVSSVVCSFNLGVSSWLLILAACFMMGTLSYPFAPSFWHKRICKQGSYFKDAVPLRSWHREWPDLRNYYPHTVNALDSALVNVCVTSSIFRYLRESATTFDAVDAMYISMFTMLMNNYFLRTWMLQEFSYHELNIF